MKGETITGQKWMTRDECELYDYLGEGITKVCHWSIPGDGLGKCRYYRHLRDGKWAFCEKHDILIKLS